MMQDVGILSYIWLYRANSDNMPHVASSGAVALLLKHAMDEQMLGVRTLARKLFDENEGGPRVESWRGQIYRILDGQQPERPTAIKIARALGKPDGYLVQDDDPQFATALLGQLVILLEREPTFRQMRPDLLRELAAQLRDLATRLEALAAGDQAAASPPAPHE